MEETKEVTVKDLRALYESGLYNIEIDTPDGFQPITDWFNKGVLPMVELETQSGHITRCAVNHLLQDENSNWIPAGQLTVAHRVQTVSQPNDEIIRVDEIADEECFDFTVNHPNHRYWGDGMSSHNSGKSYFCSGNIVKHAQEQGIFVILIDSENALDESWMQALGVDTSPENLLKLSICMIDDVAKTISEFMKEYKAMPADDRPKVLFVVDSLGMLLTPTDVNQFEAGDMKGDMGRKPKALTALVRNCVNMFGNFNVGLVATNHTYGSQDPYNPDPIISGGNGFVYASSIVVAMKKLKLKEDEDGNKTTTVNGIRAGCKIMKTRYAKPFESIEVQIPYTEGMSIYSGMFDLLEARGIVKKEGNRYTYIDLAGAEHKYYRKEWNRNEAGILDTVMVEWNKQAANRAKAAVPNDTVSDVDESA